MKLKVIGSSSKGNSYILETDTGSLILDCGVRFSDIRKALDFDLSKVQGCLISHSHGDHSSSVKPLMVAGIDCYMSINTSLDLSVEKFHRCQMVDELVQFTVGNFICLPFPTEHDCPGSLGYLIQHKPTGEKIVFLTDSYYSKYKFEKVNYFLLECNYCFGILKANIEAGLIPESIKKRLLESHFSLDNVKGFLKANDLSEVRKIVLIHLSEGNSDAARMVLEISELTGKDVEAAEAGKEIELNLYPF